MMLCLCTSKFNEFAEPAYLHVTNIPRRYEIGSGAADWEEAERAVGKAGGNATNLTVAVKTGEKRKKAGEAVEEAYKEAEKFKEKGGKKKKHKSKK